MTRIYNYRIETISPLHISCGDEITAYEYLIVKDKYYRLDMDKFLFSLDEEKREKLLDLIHNDEFIEIRKFVKSNINLDSHIKYCANVTESVQEFYQNHSDTPENQLLIFPLLRDCSSNKSYIPGSSLKGAIRTAFLDYLLSNYADKKSIPKKGGKMEQFLLGYENGSQDPFRLLKFSDAFITNTSEGEEYLNELHVIKPDKYGKLLRKRIQIIAEIISGGEGSRKSTLFEGEIRFNDELLSLIKSHKIFGNNLVEQIYSYCNKFYSAEMNREIEKFYDKAQDHIKRCVVNIQKKSEFQDACLIRLGRYCGFESKTLNYIRQKKITRDGKPDFIKEGSTRNLAGGLFPMGWAKLTIKEKN